MSARFPLGAVVATPGAIEALAVSGQNAAEFLDRHVRGDFGDLDAEDKQSNLDAIREDARILSAYVLTGGERLWIITEADRSSTCCLLPSEY
jgi:glycine cleavage system aminomethyltransferase T